MSERLDLAQSVYARLKESAIQHFEPRFHFERVQQTPEFPYRRLSGASQGTGSFYTNRRILRSLQKPTNHERQKLPPSLAASAGRRMHYNVKAQCKHQRRQRSNYFAS